MLYKISVSFLFTLYTSNVRVKQNTYNRKNYNLVKIVEVTQPINYKKNQ